MSSIIGELTRNILETRFESIDEASVEHAKNRIIDTIGCLIGGANAAGCRELVELVKGWGGKPESTILIHGVQAPAHNAAMVNSVMVRSFDFEPVEAHVAGKNIPSHITGTTVPTALAVAEWQNVSGKELITALILGDDLAARITAAAPFSFDTGWSGTGTENKFGATAVAGRLLGLNETQLSDAFGIALNQMAGTFQNYYDAALCFKLPIGFSASAGIVSAELARAGFGGLKDPLLSKHGYFALYCQGCDPETLTQDLGKKFFSDRTFKPYPACRATHGGIACALELVRQHDIDTDKISEITVGVTDTTSRMFACQPFEIGRFPQVNASFSLQYTVATVLARKAIKLEHFTEEYIRDPKIVDLAGKVRIVAKIPPERRPATDLEVTMKTGETYFTNIERPGGDSIYNPPAPGAIREKFRENVAFSKTISQSKAENVLKLIEDLEKLDNVASLIEELS